MLRLGKAGLILTALVSMGFGDFGAARASIVVYNDSAAFQAASTGLTTIDFEGLAPPSSSTQYFNDLSTGGVDFSTNNLRLFVLDPNFLFPNFFLNSGQYLQDNFGTPSHITATLPGGITAVGADLSDLSNPLDTMTVTLSTGDVINVPAVPTPNYAFIGFVSTTPISSVTFSAPNNVSIDNFSYGTAIATPEPTTLALGLIGAVGSLGYVIRRRKFVDAWVRLSAALSAFH